MNIKKIILLVMFFFVLIFISNKVSAMTIVLDPGHGGQDPGAVNGNVYEKNINLKIARYIKEYLEPYQDTNVILTHDGFSEGELTIFERAIIARNKKADILISIHINSSSTSTPNGAEIYVTANKSLDKYNKETTELSQKILNNLSKIGIANRGVLTKLIPSDTTDIYTDGTRADYMGIIRYAMRGTMIDDGKVTILENGEKVEVPASTSANVQKGEGVPAILIEHCFIKGSDYQYIDSEDDIKKLAKADADAIVEHYDLKLKEEEEENEDIKINEKESKIIIAPEITVEDILEFMGKKEYSILNEKNEIIEKKKEKLATGYKIKFENISYTIVKVGDVTGDGNLQAVDALAIIKYKTGKRKLEGVYLEAADVTSDGAISSTDALAISKYKLKLHEIHL